MPSLKDYAAILTLIIGILSIAISSISIDCINNCPDYSGGDSKKGFASFVLGVSILAAVVGLEILVKAINVLFAVQATLTRVGLSGFWERVDETEFSTFKNMFSGGFTIRLVSTL